MTHEDMKDLFKWIALLIVLWLIALAFNDTYIDYRIWLEFIRR